VSTRALCLESARSRTERVCETIQEPLTRARKTVEKEAAKVHHRGNPSNTDGNEADCQSAKSLPTS